MATNSLQYKDNGIFYNTEKLITDSDNLINSITEQKASIEDIFSTLGTADGQLDLGLFSGTTILDNSSVKSALQALEDKSENPSVRNMPDGAVLFTDINGLITGDWNNLYYDKANSRLAVGTVMPGDLTFNTEANKGLIIDSGFAGTSGLKLKNLKFPATLIASLETITVGFGPQGIAIDSHNNVYTTSMSNEVYKTTSDGASSVLGITGANPLGLAIDSLGNIYTANNMSDNISKITPDGLSTEMGVTGSMPYGLAVDSLGNVYTTNQGSDNVSKITPDGVSTVYATTGAFPMGIVIDLFGNIYTANQNSNNVSKITPDGVSSILGETGNNPIGIALDIYGNVYTTNFGSNSISKITPDGVSTILTLTGPIYQPWGICIDSSQNLYVTNYGTNNVIKINQNGEVAEFGLSGQAPQSIAQDSFGNLYIANSGENTLTKLIPPDTEPKSLSVNSNGDVILQNSIPSSFHQNIVHKKGDETISGQKTFQSVVVLESGVDGTSGLKLSNLTLPMPVWLTSVMGNTGSAPVDMVIDSLNNIFIINLFNRSVTKITPNGESNIFGFTEAGPMSIAVDSLNNIYIANYISNDVTKITPNGESSIIGTTGNRPIDIAVDSNRNIYTLNKDSLDITKITPDGVSSIFTSSSVDSKAIAIDSNDNIYCIDYVYNNITKITPSGVSSFFASTGAGPQCIVVDSNDNVYTGNNVDRNVSKITPDGVSTIVGTTGTGPWNIALDSFGNIYTTNQTSKDISQITPNGESSIIGSSGNNPYGIAVDTSGNVYTANWGDDHLTKLTPPDKTPKYLSVTSTGEVVLQNGQTFSIDPTPPTTSWNVNANNKFVFINWAGTTTNNTITEIFIDNIPTNRLTIPSNSTVAFEITISGKDILSGDSGVYKIIGAIKKNSISLATFVGAPIKSLIAEDDVGWDVEVVAGADYLGLMVVGDGGGNTVNWMAHGEILTTQF